MFEEFVKMMNSKGYEVVPQYEGIQGIDYCNYIKNGHVFKVYHCDVRNGPQNKFFVRMDGKTIVTRCLFYDVIPAMEEALRNI